MIGGVPKKFCGGRGYAFFVVFGCVWGRGVGGKVVVCLHFLITFLMIRYLVQLGAVITIPSKY